MAALLVALSVMAVMMTVAMPVWKQTAQREKEEELVFRGKQYAHAIGLFQRKFPGALPPNIDILVEQKFLRKKYKDPITNSDFQPLTQAQVASTGSSSTGASGRGGTPTTPPTGTGAMIPPVGAAPTPTAPGSGQRGAGPPASGGAVGGIIGVTSKSKDPSIRIYNGRSHYNEWAFVYTPQTAAPGVGAPGAIAPGTAPGGRGIGAGPGQRQGQPGQPPPGPGRGFQGPEGPFGPGRGTNPQGPVTRPRD